MLKKDIEKAKKAYVAARSDMRAARQEYAAASTAANAVNLEVTLGALQRAAEAYSSALGVMKTEMEYTDPEEAETLEGHITDLLLTAMWAEEQQKIARKAVKALLK